MCVYEWMNVCVWGNELELDQLFMWKQSTYKDWWSSQHGLLTHQIRAKFGKLKVCFFFVVWCHKSTSWWNANKQHWTKYTTIKNRRNGRHKKKISYDFQVIDKWISTISVLQNEINGNVFFIIEPYCKSGEDTNDDDMKQQQN